MTEHVYPEYPNGRSKESAYYLLNGPRDQRLAGLRTLIQDCDLHIGAAPKGWCPTGCIALRDEAQDFLTGELTWFQRT
jgi:hypothetical protein